jgi:hypothetical protein
MSTKTPNKRALQRAAKKVGVTGVNHGKTVDLKEQYSIIREDLMKLKDDLAKGFDMTKTLFQRAK